MVKKGKKGKKEKEKRKKERKKEKKRKKEIKPTMSTIQKNQVKRKGIEKKKVFFELRKERLFFKRKLRRYEDVTRNLTCRFDKKNKPGC